jgi:hypothetical protein
MLAPALYALRGGDLTALAVELGRPIFWIAFLAGILIHEVLHVLGLMAYGISRSQIRLTFNPRELQLAVQPLVPVPVNQYRVVLILPFVLLGLLPSIASGWMRNEFFVAYSAMMVAICFFDVEDRFMLSSVGRNSNIVVTDND